MLNRMIYLIGPGGAGKTTSARLLAEQLGLPFYDLDAQFIQTHGGIDEFIAASGYKGYARANFEAYQLVAGRVNDGLLALSSGFMTYPADIHPDYSTQRDAVARNLTTFVLLPALDLESCVAEIVRRQMTRGLDGRVAEREEAKIRERFTIYGDIPAVKIVTMRRPAEIVADIASRLQKPPRRTGLPTV